MNNPTNHEAKSRNADLELVIKIGTRTAKRTVCWYDKRRKAIEYVRIMAGQHLTDTKRRELAAKIYEEHPDAVVFGASGGRTESLIHPN